MATYNTRKGIFGNIADSEQGLKKGVDEVFEDWDVRVIGVVAVFAVRKLRVVELL